MRVLLIDDSSPRQDLIEQRLQEALVGVKFREITGREELAELWANAEWGADDPEPHDPALDDLEPRAQKCVPQPSDCPALGGDRVRELERRVAELETLLKVLPVGIGIAYDTECWDIRVNPAFAAMLAISPDANASLSADAEERPANFMVCKDGRELASHELPMQVAAREGLEMRDLEVELIRSDGQILTLLEYAAPLYDEAGQLRGSVGAFVDISDRRRLLSQLESHAAQLAQARDDLEVNVRERTATLFEQEQRLAILHQVDQAILAAQSAEGIAGNAVAHLRRLLGCQRASVMMYDWEAHQAELLAVASAESTSRPPGTRTSLDLITIPGPFASGEPYVIPDLGAEPAGQNQAADEVSKALLTDGIRTYLSVPLLAEDRLLGSLNLGAAQPHAFDDNALEVVRQVAASLTVALKNAWLTQQIQQDRARLQGLSRRLVEAQELERKAISRELHDEAGQALTVLMIGLGMLERDCKTYAPHLVEQVKELKRTTDGVIEGLHRLSRNLRPASLDRLGLVAAVRQHIKQFEGQTAIPVEFMPINLGEERFPPEVEITAYRVVQEALTNVARHAQAGRASVILKRRGDRLLAIIEDNGRGLNVKKAMARGRLGLQGMRERAEMLGGRFSLESTPGSGTTIFVEILLAPPE